MSITVRDMNIWLVNDTSHNHNWGCVATSTGLRRSLLERWPQASIHSLRRSPLPFRFIKQMRRLRERRIISCIRDTSGDLHKLSRALEKLNCTLPIEPLPDRLYLNGEGMMHRNSGHLIVLLGLLALIKRRGGWCAAVNQTIDITGRPDLESLVSSVFKSLDHVTVRDPISLRSLHDLGVHQATLVPDAAFVTPMLDDTETRERMSQLNLPPRYIALTGSSSLHRGSIPAMHRMMQAIRKVIDLPLVLLSSTKTDTALGTALKRKDPTLRMIEAPAADYRDAIAAIANAHLLVGGRFHPMIFAALAGTPIVAFEGNTWKLHGLCEMLNYDVPVLNWNSESAVIEGVIAQVHRQRDDLGQKLREHAVQLRGQVSQLTGK